MDSYLQKISKWKIVLNMEIIKKIGFQNITLKPVIWSENW